MTFDDTREYDSFFQTRFVLAIQYLMNEQYEEAVEILRSLHAVHPDSASVSMFLGRSLYQLDHLDEAKLFLELAMKKFPSDPDLLRARGRVSLSEYDFDEARRFFMEALTYDSTDRSAIELIETYVADNDEATAKAIWNDAVKRYGMTDSLAEYLVDRDEKEKGAF